MTRLKELIAVSSASVRSPSAKVVVPGTYNLRDLGGLGTIDGRRIRHGALYRSDALHLLDDAGRAAVRGLGLRSIVDLRSDDEVASQPSALDAIDLDVHHVPLFARAAPSSMGELTLAAVYGEMVRTCGEAFVGAVRAVLADAPVLVHCTAGKDRTGLVVAFGLEAMGVHRDEVVADYALSGANLDGEWASRHIARLETLGVAPSAALRTILVSSPPDVLRDVLEGIDEQYRSPRAYLAAYGLEPDELAALATLFTEEE
ncbi:MAG: tyrosine-protein phosphatase [Acidimicrobiaceae bacterium]|nr:tyrosine-protein phosphatase [Acidimicrobiaceae bacterium]